MNRIFVPAILCIIFICNTSFFERNTSKGNYLIVISKHNYELNVYDDDGWLVTYPVVFGNKDLGDKMVQGDRETPEGSFKIVNKRVHEKWDRFMMLNYPTPEDYAKFNLRKEQGLIPPNAQIGGGVGIHGTWPHESYAIDQYQNWTQGCISMKDEDVEELYAMIPVGTTVVIKK